MALKKFKVRNGRGSLTEVRIVPFAGSGVQFLLLDLIGMIRSVGIADFEGKFIWKFGEPVPFSKKFIEEDIRHEMSLGRYFKG